MKNLHVEVTQAAIDGAEHMAIGRCPISRAINRHMVEGQPYPLIETASVHLTDGHCTLTERMDGGTVRTVYKFALPGPAQAFVKRWDAREDVEPFSFDLMTKEHGPRLMGSSL